MLKKLTAAAAMAALVLTLSAPAQAAGAVPLDAAHFPDAVFRAYLAETADTDGDKVLSEAECAAVTRIDITNTGFNTISDMTGIAFFPELQTLIISKSNVSKLDVSQNKYLDYLACDYAKLPYLDLESVDLENLIMEDFVLNCVHQSIEVKATFADGAWQIDLNELVGQDRMNRVRVQENEGVRFQNGIVTVPHDASDADQEQDFFYYYDTKSPANDFRYGEVEYDRGQKAREMPVYVWFSTAGGPAPTPAPTPTPTPEPSPAPQPGPGADQGGVEGFVARLYSLCLGRAPRDGEDANWVNSLATGAKAGSECAYGFYFSQEFTSRNYSSAEYVTLLYRAMMSREPDEGGLQDWVGRLAAGAPREVVFNGFVGSQEFTNLCASYGIVRGDGDGISAFVDRLYRVCFDRGPDVAGFNDWTAKLRTQTATGTEVAHGFACSQEMANLGLNDEQYVEAMYRAFFDREYDDAGKADWMDRMHAQGYDREQVFYGFAGSQEFENLCKRYGITR